MRVSTLGALRLAGVKPRERGDMRVLHRVVAGSVAGVALMAPTAAQAVTVDVSPGDHFSNRYLVSARTPYFDSDVVNEKWTVKRGGKTVKKTRSDGWWLEPGKYRFEYRVTAKKQKSVKPLGDFEYSVNDKCSMSMGDYVTTHEPKTGVFWTGQLPPGASNVRSFAEYHAYGYRPGGYYYDKDFRSHDVADPGMTFGVDQIPQEERWRFDGDERFVWVSNGYYAFATYLANQPDVRARGTVTCGSKRYGYSYSGAFAFTRPQSYFDLGNKVTLDDLSSDTPLALKTSKKLVYKSVKTKTVKAKNGSDVTPREARSVRVGMSQTEVHRIFGTSGQQMMKASGFETREYDDWVYIGYVNGRVNSIQRY